MVTISHNHYDHLDIPSLKLIQKKFPEVIFLVPVGDKALLKKYKLKNIYELTWWETFTLKETKFTFTPTQHWSARGIFDRNESLWGGWYFETKNLKLFHAGDTGYSKILKILKISLANLTMLLYLLAHMIQNGLWQKAMFTPEDAVRIMEDLGNPNSFGMHWGTFALTSEDTLEPLERLKTYTSSLGIQNFITLTPGDIFKLNN